MFSMVLCIFSEFYSIIIEILKSCVFMSVTLWNSKIEEWIQELLVGGGSLIGVFPLLRVGECFIFMTIFLQSLPINNFLS